MANSYLESIFGLTGKVALVAGASSGMGVEFARALAMAGADVVLGARRLERVEALAKEIAEQTGRKTLAVSLDVTNAESVKAAFDKAEAELGTPTVVCNNAGIGVPQWAIDVDEKGWDATMDTNLKGMWRVATTAAQRMRAAGVGGSIINTASILGLGVTPAQMTYCTSKAAVVQMTKSMGMEFQRFGIRVNAICPGYFKTEINDTFLDSEAGQKFVAQSPAKRVGKLEELIPAVLMFASDTSGFTSGAALPVDGVHSAYIV